MATGCQPVIFKGRCPAVNGKTPEYGGKRFNDPFVKSEYQSGIIEVDCGGTKVTLAASNPENITRTEEKSSKTR
ncbi:MAG: hypothetical protein QF437_15090 [Planctomycetota bacterium]|nr:hypothetical protein [Planctomycetota bacterium]MDP7131820.1 hypothetical protein [Planctomycetota bacterium]